LLTPDTSHLTPALKVHDLHVGMFSIEFSIALFRNNGLLPSWSPSTRHVCSAVGFRNFCNLFLVNPENVPSVRRNYGSGCLINQKVRPIPDQLDHVSLMLNT